MEDSDGGTGDHDSQFTIQGPRVKSLESWQREWALIEYHDSPFTIQGPGQKSRVLSYKVWREG